MASEGAPALRCVLVTNDDGIDAPGLLALVKVLGAAGLCRVFVCAPDQERSAIANAITVRQTLEANLREVEGAELAYALSGTPADCASVAIGGKLFGPSVSPVLVLSGINKGANSGLHIIYSGTVGGAREAFMYGISAISLSLDWGRSSDDSLFLSAASHSLPIIQAALSYIESDGSLPLSVDLPTSPALPFFPLFLNVNIPIKPDENNGFRLCSQGFSRVRPQWKAITKRRTGAQLAAAAMGGGVPLLNKMMGPPAAGRGMALPGMGVPIGAQIAQINLAASIAGAARKRAGGEKEGDGERGKENAEEPSKEFENDLSNPLHNIHFQHLSGSWEHGVQTEDDDHVCLAQNYITVSALGLISPPPVEAYETVRNLLSSL